MMDPAGGPHRAILRGMLPYKIHDLPDTTR